jgi:hypothetical protein
LVPWGRYVRSPAVPPEVLEPARRQRRIASGILDIAVLQVGLEEAGIDPVIGQLKAACVDPQMGGDATAFLAARTRRLGLTEPTFHANVNEPRTYPEGPPMDVCASRWVTPGPASALPQLVAIDDSARSARHVVGGAALDKRVYARVAKQDQRCTIIMAAHIARDLPSLREQLVDRQRCLRCRQAGRRQHRCQEQA